MENTRPSPEFPETPDLSDFNFLSEEDFSCVIEILVFRPIAEQSCTCECHSNPFVEHFSPCCCQHQYMWVCPECNPFSDKTIAFLKRLERIYGKNEKDM